MEDQTFGSNLKRTAKKTLKIIIIVILLGAAAVFSFYYWGVYDEGVRAGTIIRVSKKGILFKTYEGQLNLETFGSLKGASPIKESFEFSVEPSRDDLVKELEAVALSGERVNIHYIKRYVTFPWRGDTKYFVRKIERVKHE
jgi:hypothetical protein